MYILVTWDCNLDILVCVRLARARAAPQFPPSKTSRCRTTSGRSARVYKAQVAGVTGQLSGDDKYYIQARHRGKYFDDPTNIAHIRTAAGNLIRIS